MTVRNHHSEKAGRGEHIEQAGTGAGQRSARDASIADDRGFDRERRSFNGDREYDELGSEMEDLGFDAADDELGAPGQRH